MPGKQTIGDMGPWMLLWIIFLVATLTMLFWRGAGLLFDAMFRALT